MSGRRGGALPLAMACVTVLCFMTAAGFALMRAQVRETLYEVRLAQAQAIAEAGLEDAMNKVMLTPSWRTGYVEKPFAGGYYTVTVSTDQMPWIESTGYAAAFAGLGRPARTVRAQALFDGFYNFSATTFTVTWQTTAYDSALDATPTCQNSNMNVRGCRTGDHVWANTSIITTPGAIRINGDATYATPTSTAPAASTVAGAVKLAPSTTTIDVQDGALFSCTTCNDNFRLPAQAFSGVTGALHITSTMTVTLSSGVYYLTGIYSSGTLRINLPSRDYSVSIYLYGPLWVGGNNGQIDNNGSCGVNGGGCKAYNVHIYGQGGESIYLGGFNRVDSNDNITYLDIYCPGDDVVINQRMLGRVIGRSVRIQNPYGNGNRRPVFFFDLQFGFAQVDGARWVSETWSESYYKP